MKNLLLFVLIGLTSCTEDKPSWLTDNDPEYCWYCEHITQTDTFYSDECNLTISEIRAFERHNSPAGTRVYCVRK